MKVRALGEYVVLEAGHKVASPGETEKSAGGIITGTKSVGEVPKYAKIVSIGPDVPKELGLKEDAYFPLPPGNNMRNVPDPDVAFNDLPEKDGRKMFMAHWKFIGAVYED